MAEYKTCISKYCLLESWEIMCLVKDDIFSVLVSTKPCWKLGNWHVATTFLPPVIWQWSFLGLLFCLPYFVLIRMAAWPLFKESFPHLLQLLNGQRCSILVKHVFLLKGSCWMDCFFCHILVYTSLFELICYQTEKHAATFFFVYACWKYVIKSW